ncbi:MAG: DUF4936 family protein [Betaproteobacteria bacterium]|nr:DUF4936 family protein [Betaproteobacteria bacterium]
MPLRLYVYYRVDQADFAAVQLAALSLQSTLCRDHPGLQAELLRRPDLRDGQATLMETYAQADGVDAALAQAIEAAAIKSLARWLKGPRHCERFEPLG